MGFRVAFRPSQVVLSYNRSPGGTLDESTELALPAPDFDALVAELAKLSRKHLLYFRIEVGRRLSAAFYHDDRELYRSSNRRKEGSFREFVAEKGAALADLGLSEALLRQSLLAFFTVQGLPRAVVAQLVYSHVVKLTSIDDDQTRGLLARAAVENSWNGQALQNAIEAVRAGRWPDADPETPGLQAAELAPPSADASAEREAARPLAPGRVVTRVEKTAREIGSLAGQWAQVPLEKLSKDHAKRVREALAAAEREIALMKKRLPK